MKIPDRRSHNGAAAELLVSSQLLYRGWDVFRAVAMHCPCDLVAMKDKMLLRIEVRTGVMNSNGLYWPKTRLNLTNFDHLAVVDQDGIIHWVPELP